MDVLYISFFLINSKINVEKILYEAVSVYFLFLEFCRFESHTNNTHFIKT